MTTCELVTIDGLELAVRGLDAIDTTPIIDIKAPRDRVPAAQRRPATGVDR